MAVRTIVEIPESLTAELRCRAQQTGVSVNFLIVAAIEQTYPTVSNRKKGTRVTGPMITGNGKRGPRFPVDENPHDLVFS